MRRFEFIPEGSEGCSVTAWLHGEGEGYQSSPAIIICPGGGYTRVSAREAEPVAGPYYEAGYHTFILTYSVGEKAKDFTPLCQLAATLAHIREYADRWNVDPKKIAVCGFSAGGHLAASLGTRYREHEFWDAFCRRTELSDNRESSDCRERKLCPSDIRPDAMILGYPVITADAYAHEGSIKTVSGAEVGSEEYAGFGLDQYVDGQTPPTYLWHTAADSCVPVENSLKFCMALSKAKVPFEYHVFPEGEHGMSVCTEAVGTPCAYNARWMEWSIQWLDKLFDRSENGGEIN